VHVTYVTPRRPSSALNFLNRSAGRALLYEGSGLGGATAAWPLVARTQIRRKLYKQ
jgi:hypothetical protein